MRPYIYDSFLRLGLLQVLERGLRQTNAFDMGRWVRRFWQLEREHVHHRSSETHDHRNYPAR